MVAGGCLAIALQASELSAKLDLARAAMQARDYGQAAQLFGDSVPLAASDAERVDALALYGLALNRAGRNREAKPVLEQALAAGARGQTAAAALAAVYRETGDYGGAERVLLAAIRNISAGGADRAALLVNLADLLREEARWNEAGRLLNNAEALPDLPYATRLSILVERAELRRELQQWRESVADWTEVGRIAEREHSQALEEVYTGGLGETWLASGDTARAEPLLRRSLDLLRKDPASSSPQIAMALALTASVYLAQNKLALADDALAEAISRDELCLGPEHPQMAMLLELRASILSRRGDANAAREDLGRARSIMTAHFGAESAAVAGVDAALGDVEERARRPELAAAAYASALTLLRKTGEHEIHLTEHVASRYQAAVRAARRRGESNAALAFTH
jgi:tetratricopeptide (TPR) repeat protein